MRALRLIWLGPGGGSLMEVVAVNAVALKV